MLQRTMPSTVLGFFPDHETAARALSSVRGSHFGHVVAVKGSRNRIRRRRSGGGILREVQALGRRGLSLGVDDSLIAPYRRWALPDETLVLFQSPPERIAAAISLLRGGSGDGTTEPATFVLRQEYSGASVTLPHGTSTRPQRFTAERLKLRATRLAARQEVRPVNAKARHRPLWDGLRRWERSIETVTRDLAAAAAADQHVSLAGQWLLDNAYLVRRQIADVRRNFSHELYDVLPVLQRTAGGAQAARGGGEPRIYELALEFVAHSEAQVGMPELVDFLRAYQGQVPLTMGELWAMPLTLRLALIESVAQLALEIDQRQLAHERADVWANRLLSAVRRDPDYLLIFLAELAGEYVDPQPYFVDRLVSQLQGEPAALDPIRGWLEHKLGASIPAVVQREQLRLASDQVMIANAISSLRLLGQVDWRDVFEQVSRVDEVLRQDPAGVYANMDFGTRDSYRHAVEEMARRGCLAEVEVAQATVRASAAAGADNPGWHIGYFLAGAGRPQLEALLGVIAAPRERLRRRAMRHPATVYVGGIALATVMVLSVLLGLLSALGGLGALGGPGGAASVALALLVLLLAVLPASEVAVQLMNYAVTHLLSPRLLPKLAFPAGIPDEWRTLVVVPMLLSPDGVESELERLEIRFLGNRDPNLRFALLADFQDAPRREMPGDDALFQAAVAGMAVLNERYETAQFSLFSRQRVWSETERVWMGWERKRGKLEELNRLLVGLSETGAGPSTLEHAGALGLEQFAGTRFVITLDSDTQLPQGAARRLVETMAHPLNRTSQAPGDARSGGHAVAGGYTIVQPRVSTSLPSATATRFSRVFTDPVGTDPYTHAVPDVYQDLAGEGSYHGKGIYDLHAFHAVLDGRFPPALLLSHDLLEGAHVRVGLASDIDLFDLFPGSYQAYASREHRWIRGDWQIADWCTPWVPNSSGGRAPNLLSPINRWKIFDNLRRSLVPPAMVVGLTASWLLAPVAAGLFSALAVLVLWLPPTLGMVTWLVSQVGEAPAAWRHAQGWKEQSTGWRRAVFVTALLPHQAAISADAIWRVFYRRAVSRRDLLAWQTSSTTSAHGPAQLRRFASQMGWVSLFAALVAALLAVMAPGALPAALPFIVLWLLSPVAVVWLSGRPARQAQRPLTPADSALLRRVARQTWRYFDDFVGPQSHWLPPDNYQVALTQGVAERTSPTNIGLWLLATLAAHDFGYLTLDQTIERGLATLETLQQLEHYEGHLYNWYDTGTLQPLPPRYVSTVDSGNLLASLWTFTQGHIEKLDQPVLGPAALRGLHDAVAALQEQPVTALPAALLASPAAARVKVLTGTLVALANPSADDVHEIIDRLRQAVEPARELAQLVAVPPQPPRDGPTNAQDADSQEHMSGGAQLAYWAAQVQWQVTSQLDIADRYLTWLDPSDQRPAGPTRAPSLRALAAGDLGPAGALPAVSERAEAVARARWLAGEVLAQAEQLIEQAERLAKEMNMRFLFRKERKLFTIGYNASEQRTDQSLYDLLASESRLGSLVSIARGDVPVDHWLALGRPYGRAAGRPALLSWTGTMFEYLMPLLLTRSYENSLLDEACQEAVAAQVAYGALQEVPWGNSEAAYSAVDAHQIYQYRAFGTPGLGLKRGLEDDLVVAPYATALALMVAPRQAIRNLRSLARAGLGGAYGYYESIDYTPRRRSSASQPDLRAAGSAGGPDVRRRKGSGRGGTIIYTYMAHHQGMTLLALDNVLHHNVMPARFHADPRVRSVESLLFERIPVAPHATEGSAREGATMRTARAPEAAPSSRFSEPDSPAPRVQLLGNQSFSVMVTSAGGGYTRWRGLDVARWYGDTTRDGCGSFIYLRDLDDGTTWSAAHQPVGRRATSYSALFAPGRVEFERQDAGIRTRTEITVSAEDDAEVRRVTLANLSRRTRHLEITSYVELALAAHGADRAHPAFSKMFVRTEALPSTAPGQPPDASAPAGPAALLAWRTPRGKDDPPIWAAHILAIPPEMDAPAAAFQYETNRGRFIGRGRSPQRPLALQGDLSNEAGHVLDPIFSLRCRLTLAPGQRVQFAYITAAAESRRGVLALVEKYRDLRAVERAFELTWFRAQLIPRQLGVSMEDLARFQRLASAMLYPSAAQRANEPQLRQNRLGQSRLWTHGLSGDLPLLVVQIDKDADLDLVREALTAHAAWRLAGLWTDLVILNEEAASYEQSLAEALKRLVHEHAQLTGEDRPGGIFLRSADHLPAEDRALLLAVAHAVLVASHGPLVQQLATRVERPKLPPPLIIGRRAPEEPSAPLPFMELTYFNGVGGFTQDGSEYAIYLGPDTHTPAPWVNVMANPNFGALISETGQGFAWAGNSQSNRLLPWSNDPVVDPSGDAIYIRDEQSGIFWTPTASPVREVDAYRARHGQGYSVFEHNSHAIEQELVVTVPIDNNGGSPVRVQRLRLRNRSSRQRRLTLTAYAEWVLGSNREEAQMHVVTSWDAEAEALLAQNHYHPTFGSRVAFASASVPVSSYTADRTEFLGRNGSTVRPAAMAARVLSGRTGAGLDPCAALQVLVELNPGQETEVTFVLGQAADLTEARSLVRAYADSEHVAASLDGTRAWWERLLQTVQVETPDLAVNFLLNRWLPYQTLSCRIWGRSGFYQSGGAIGFRDQLQDSMAVVYADPALARRMLLTAAAHQFPEGDVQHWWHPDSGAGVRTRCSDDLLWLPFVTAHYVRVTGDAAVLDELAPFLDGRVLGPTEHEAYFVPATTPATGTLLQHCRLALAKGLTAGAHGLPLMGTGDWNDGMNLVGAGGKGESTWLAWFLIDVLNRFADLLDSRDPAGAPSPTESEDYREQARRIAAAVEQTAWDGEWYLRAFFDDGTPLGSREDREAQIDSLPQSWGVLSGAADPVRARRAMESAYARLVRAHEQMVLLFTPPFQETLHDPGYVKGYPPGVRENGGQYTHGAIWLASAFAHLGDGDRAVQLLRMLNPVEHARTPEAVEQYRVEPYAVAADIYSLDGRVGQGGWTWYTGSSGWMYRVWLEEVLGFKRRGDRLELAPALPAAWDGCTLRYRHRGPQHETVYAITIENPDHARCGVAWVELDGQRLIDPAIPLEDDGTEHRVTVRLG